ncbi:MAG TPA: hypothetical protein VIM21_08025 [Gemmatimonadaceae bacterium]|jgi:uncharacterized membrane protein
MNPAPPAALATAMRNALKDANTPTAEDLLTAAEQALDRVLRSGCETRASALDLLTVDALMTHALEIASSHANAPDDFPEQALRRITSAWQ